MQVMLCLMLVETGVVAAELRPTSTSVNLSARTRAAALRPANDTLSRLAADQAQPA
jgi:hypothetical protein